MNDSYRVGLAQEFLSLLRPKGELEAAPSS